MLIQYRKLDLQSITHSGGGGGGGGGNSSNAVARISFRSSTGHIKYKKLFYSSSFRHELTILNFAIKSGALVFLASLHPGVYMGMGELNAGGNPAMDWHLIQGGVETLQVASCYRNRDKLWPDEPLGSYADFTNAFYKLLLTCKKGSLIVILI